MSAVSSNQPICAKGIHALSKNVVRTGNSSPLGATVFPDGVNFSLYLELFPEDAPMRDLMKKVEGYEP